MDSDFSHDPRFIPEMIAEQRRSSAAIVKGNRYMVGGGVHGWNLRRKLTSRVANLMAEVLLGSSVGDMTGSYRLYARDCFEKLVANTKARGYTFQMEMIMRAQAMGMRITEVPITFIDRQFGESKLGAGEIDGFLRGIWLLLWSDLSAEAPQNSITAN